MGIIPLTYNATLRLEFKVSPAQHQEFVKGFPNTCEVYDLNFNLVAIFVGAEARNKAIGWGLAACESHSVPIVGFWIIDGDNAPEFF